MPPAFRKPFLLRRRIPSSSRLYAFGRILRRACKALFFLAIAVVATSACGGTKARPLSPFVGAEAQLFDDALEPGAVGLDLEQPKSPIRDVAFRDRVKASDAVVRVRIATVTEKNDGVGRSVYELNVRIMETIWGAYPPKQESVSLLVTSTGGAYGVVKALEGRLIGKDMLVFLKRFSVPDGEGEYHFHATADSELVRKAVREATSFEDKTGN